MHKNCLDKEKKVSRKLSIATMALTFTSDFLSTMLKSYTICVHRGQEQQNQMKLECKRIAYCVAFQHRYYNAICL